MTIITEKVNPHIPEVQGREGESIASTAEEKVADKMKEQVKELRPEKLNLEPIHQNLHHPQRKYVARFTQDDISQMIMGKKRGQNVFA